MGFIFNAARKFETVTACFALNSSYSFSILFFSLRILSFSSRILSFSSRILSFSSMILFFSLRSFSRSLRNFSISFFIPSIWSSLIVLKAPREPSYHTNAGGHTPGHYCHHGQQPSPQPHILPSSSQSALP